MSATQLHALGWILLCLLFTCYPRNDNVLILEGTVVDEHGAVAQASVRWQGRQTHVLTDAQGRFRLPGVPNAFRITASKKGYRIASVPASLRPLSLRLFPLPGEDDRDYEWIDPHADPLHANNCANCHGEIHQEWKGSAHAHAATNPKFLHLFAGSDGRAPVHKTWNVQAEHPDGAAVCALCHVPTLRSPNLDYDVRAAEGVARSGVHCDYCHKIVAAPTDKIGIRLGRDGLELLRPRSGDTLTFGPLDDAVRKGESFASLPFYKESRYCASCHEGVVFGVHVYGTYSEWLESPAPAQGKQCQDCHMTPTGQMTNIAPGKGGVRRDPSSLASHHFPGGQRDMLRQCLTMKAVAKSLPQGRSVEVEIVADHVGHRVPTGFIDRQLVLTVEASDVQGRHMDLLDGGRLPACAGKWQGLAGRLYAKQLFDEQGHTPVPFWRSIEKMEDTRLLPQQPDRRTFLFPRSARHATIRLWYRRFWQEVADARGWRDNDVLVREVSLSWHP